MKILVCIKQVPDMESKFKIDADGVWYDRSDLTVLCIGPDQVKETMKKALPAL